MRKGYLDVIDVLGTGTTENNAVRIQRLCAELEEVPSRIFTAGIELATVNIINGSRGAQFDPLRLEPAYLDRVERRIAAYKKTQGHT